MTFNKTLLTAALVTVGGFAAMSGANAAGTAIDTFDVSLKVETSCSVETGTAMALEIVAGVQPAIGSSTFDVACSKNTPFTISMLPSGVTKAGIGTMVGTLENIDTITYQLATDASGETIWTDNVKGGTGAGMAQPETFNVYAKVTSDIKDILPDTYSQNVTVSVAY